MTPETPPIHDPAAVHAVIERTARDIVRTHPEVDAVVLFGSRARGNPRPNSDWDVALLCRRDIPRAETLMDPAGATRPDAAIETFVLDTARTNARAHRLGSLERSLVDEGHVLAGHWTRPRPKEKDDVIDDQSIELALRISACALRNACIDYANLRRAERERARGEDTETAVTVAGNEYQTHLTETAEFWARACVATLGLSPQGGHKLDDMGAAVLAQADRQSEDTPRNGDPRRQARWFALQEQRYWAFRILEANGENVKRRRGRYDAHITETLSSADRKFIGILRTLADWLHAAPLITRAETQTQKDARAALLERVKKQIAAEIGTAQSTERYGALPENDPIGKAIVALEDVCEAPCGEARHRQAQERIAHEIGDTADRETPAEIKALRIYDKLRTPETGDESSRPDTGQRR